MSSTKATKGDIKRAVSLLKAIHDLQFRIYNFDSHLEDKGLLNIAQLVTESGFELDVSHQKMEDAVKRLQASNYGPQ